MTDSKIPDVSDIPEVLRSARWVSWKSLPADKPGAKPRKVPVDPKTGQNASTTNPDEWGTLEDAISRTKQDKLAGIGLIFYKGSGLVGIDLDKCRHPITGDLSSDARIIVERLNSYTEVSPSCTGVHIIIDGELPAGGRRKDWIEMYDTGRFFTFTGQHVSGTPQTVDLRQAELAELHADVFGKGNRKKKRPTPPKSEAIPSLSDDQIFQRGLSGKRGRILAKLWGGRWEGEYQSQSDADFAFCMMLLEAGADGAAVDRLFRESDLMREKWDEARGEATYGELTIKAALQKHSDGSLDGDGGEALIDVVRAILSTAHGTFYRDACGEHYVSYREAQS